MAYQTGAVSSPENLRVIINHFIAANGFSTHINIDSMDCTSVAGSVTRIKTGLFTLGHMSDVPTISYKVLGLIGSLSGAFTDDCSMTTGLNGTTCQICIPESQWPVTYHLFCYNNPSFCMGILSYGAGVNQWFMFGDLQKSSSSYAGGNFIAASFSSRAAIDGWGSNEVDLGATANRSDCGGFFPEHQGSPYKDVNLVTSWCYTNIDLIGWGGNNPAILAPRVAYLLSLFPSSISTIPILFPARLTQTLANSQRMDLGQIPWLRLVRMDYYEDGQIVALGDDKWKIFAWARKSSVYPTGYFSCQQNLHTQSYVDSTGKHYLRGPQTGIYGFALKV